MRRILLTICFLLSIPLAYTQTWEAGFSAGASGYMGDINPVVPYRFTDMAFGGLVKRNFNGYLSAKASLVQGTVRGADADSDNPYQQDRNLSFSSEISELSLQLEFNLFNYLPGFISGFRPKKFSPFIFTGVSAFTFNPVADLNGDEIELQPLQTEGFDYKKRALSIPYGAGVKYNIGGNWNLIGEIGYRTAFTDYIDDISGRYPDFTAVAPASPVSPQFSDRSLTMANRAGLQRGDFRKRDTYMFSLISLTYTFVSTKCPMF